MTIRTISRETLVDRAALAVHALWAEIEAARERRNSGWPRRLSPDAREGWADWAAIASETI